MIRRRLLHKGIVFPARDWKFTVATVTAVLFTVWLYYFLVSIREVFRHEMMPTQLHHIHWLTPIRAYVYDVFLAFISTTVGFSVFTRVWLIHRGSIRALVKSQIIFDQIFAPALFILLALKFCVMLGILGWAVDFYDQIDFIREFWALLLLAPMYIFLQQWITIRTYFREATAKLMLWVGTVQLTFCLLIALFPIFDYNALDKVFSNTPVEGEFAQHFPESKYYHRVLRWSMTAFLDIGFVNDDKQPSYYFSHYGRLEKVDAIALKQTIQLEREKVEEYSQDRLTLYIYADVNIKASKFKAVIDSAQKGGVMRFLFGCNDRDRGMGLPYRIYDERITADDDRINLKVSATVLSMDGKPVTSEFLERWSYQEMVRNKKNEGNITYVFIEFDPGLTYGRLFEVQRALFSGQEKFRKDEVMKEFGEVYIQNDYRGREFARFVESLGEIRPIIEQL